MLETEEVDDDFFTPVAKTSLANIFKKPLSDEQIDKETLKYTPPVPKLTQNQEDTQNKRTYENVFSCVFDAYLWIDNVYTPKGKLGCAIVNITAEGSPTLHSILLYDSKKSTLSSATLTKELKVTVKGKKIISYYDRYEKYWSLYGSEDDIKKIIDILKTYNVNLKILEESENESPEQHKPETANAIMSNTNMANVQPEQNAIEATDENIKNSDKKYIGSDTDSSISRKTKASILNRMANMGQSVLPPRTTYIKQTSDSSDTNESDNQIIARPKPVKNIVKKHVTEKNLFEQQRKPDAYKKAIAPRIQNSIESKAPMFAEDQLMPIQSSSIIPSPCANDLNLFMTEQRITNSELRINMTRMTDKVDHIINKINNLDSKNSNEGSSTINNEILQKLLIEYESKIKTYEELLRKVDMNTSRPQESSLTTDSLENKDEMVKKNNELIMLRNKVIGLDKSIKQKDDKISVLMEDIEMLKKNNDSQNSKEQENKYLAKISEIEQVLQEKNEMLAKLTDHNEEMVPRDRDDQIENKIKAIMNDTFQAIAVNFDQNESYSGESVKHIIATVIKKVTIESLRKSK